MTSARPPIPMTSALALGLREAVSLAGATVALFAARAMAGLSLASLSWIVLGTWLVGRAPVGIAAAAGLLVLWLCCELLAGVVLAGALSQGKARLLGLPVPGFPQAVVAETSRGLTYPLWAMAVQLLVTLWRWSAIWAAGTLYFRAIERGSGGLGGSSALALALVLALPLSLLAVVWLRVALVESVHAGASVGTSMFEAVGLLRRHFFAPIALIVVAAVLAGFAEGSVTATLAPLASPRQFTPEVLRLAALATLTSVVLAALPAALFELAGWHGLMALRLSWSGLLPAPPSARGVGPAPGGPALAGGLDRGPLAGPGPVIEARPVLPGRIVDARPLGARAAEWGPEPIVEARPIPGVAAPGGWSQARAEATAPGAAGELRDPGAVDAASAAAEGPGSLDWTGPRGPIPGASEAEDAEGRDVGSPGAATSESTGAGEPERDEAGAPRRSPDE